MGERESSGSTIGTVFLGLSLKVGDQDLHATYSGLSTHGNADLDRGGDSRISRVIRVRKEIFK